MATSTNYPLPVYNYRVSIDGKNVAFSEVSGLELSYETITYKESREGSSTLPGPNVIYMPGMQKPLYITLKRGYAKGSGMLDLYNWIRTIKVNTVTKKDILIMLCDEVGNPVVKWLVKDAFPIKLSAPGFNAAADEIAIESLELMAGDLEMPV